MLRIRVWLVGRVRVRIGLRVRFRDSVKDYG